MRIRQFTVAAVLALVACTTSNDGTGTSAKPVASVAITGASGSFATGTSVQLTAAAFDAGGAQIASPGTFSWSSSAPSVATVDQAGKVSTLAAGTTNISATVVGVTGTAALTVSSLAVASKDSIFTTPTTFTPSFLTITQGSAVTFVFGGGVAHNAIFRASNPAGSPSDIQIATNQTFTRTFASKGTFNFDCTVHPGMVGTVVVQ